MPDSLASQIPYYEQWLGPWAMLPDRLAQTADLFRQTDLRLHLEHQQAAPMQPRQLTQQAGQVAVIDLTGKLMKQQASMGGGTSTVQARRDIRLAANNPDVSAIMLRIDSPGGTAAGTQELADEIAAAGKKKPVECYVEDMAASAAYWAASQADKITANPMAIVGSIGTYGVVQDVSGMAAMQGIKVHVVRAGAHKGAGTPGTEITPEQLADMQRIVDGLNEHFIAGVASGREMDPEKVRELADGRAHLAAQAKDMGLIDAIGSFDQALLELQNRTARSNQMQQSLTAPAVDLALAAEIITPVQIAAIPAAPVQTTATTQPATFAELKAACVGADAAFLVSQLEASATVDQARNSWMAEQNRRIEAAKKLPGVEAVGTKAVPAVQQFGAAKAEWDAKTEALIAKGKSKKEAFSLVDRQNPGLREAMIEQVNA